MSLNCSPFVFMSKLATVDSFVGCLGSVFLVLVKIVFGYPIPLFDST